MALDTNVRGFRRTNMANAKTPPELTRPLSPHLQIYRPMLTMVMSIFHRITGGALYVGTLLLAWWLLAVASGPNAYATFQMAAGSFIGRLGLLGYTRGLLHHMLRGLRPLVLDTGGGFGPAQREMMGRAPP